jgi:S1-C subfamily serine protease
MANPEQIGATDGRTLPTEENPTHPFDVVQLLKSASPSAVHVVNPGWLLNYTGGGVFVSSGQAHSCEVATVHHVTEGDSPVYVTVGGNTYDATLQLADTVHQIDIYKLAGVADPVTTCAEAALSTRDAQPKDLVLAVSTNDRDYGTEVKPFPILGWVAGTGQRKEAKKLPLRDNEDPERSVTLLLMRAIPGDSGSPVFDADGKLVGLIQVGGPGVTGLELVKYLREDLQKVHEQNTPPL